MYKTRTIVWLNNIWLNFSHTGLLEDDPVVSVTQWSAFMTSQSLEQAPSPTACVNKTQSSSMPASIHQQTSNVSSSTTSTVSSSTTVPYQATVLRLCTNFTETTCGCKKANGKPCSSLFPLDHYLDLRAQSSFLTHDELDLINSYGLHHVHCDNRWACERWATQTCKKKTHQHVIYTPCTWHLQNNILFSVWCWEKTNNGTKGELLS